MATRLDRFGRIVLPKDIRDSLALEPGDALEVRETDDGILLTRLAEPGDEEPLRWVDGVLVFDAIPTGSVEAGVTRDRDARRRVVAGRLKKRSPPRKPLPR